MVDEPKLLLHAGHRHRLNADRHEVREAPERRLGGIPAVLVLDCNTETEPGTPRKVQQLAREQRRIAASTELRTEGVHSTHSHKDSPDDHEVILHLLVTPRHPDHRSSHAARPRSV